MKAALQLGETATYTLKSALLVYESNDSTAVTVHNIVTHNGKPVIEAGQPVTYGAIESLASALGRNLAASYLPPNVVSLGFGQVAWFCPGARRRIWFKADGRFDGTRQETGKELSDSQRSQKLNGKFVWSPPLLFVGGDRTLQVFALAQNARPGPDTPVYRAPYWNLWDRGHVCEGNRKLANLPTPASIPAYEDGFFNSAFSHTNIKKVCNHPGGHAGLWTELSKRKTAPDAKFWRANLVKLDKTVNQVITTAK